MTEEGRKRHGMNGNTDGGAPVIKEEAPRNTYGQGGRLKFFKDGKFILELERAREGERVSWVSVNRKTFWPPQGTAASTPTYRQESSTSLSVSDDNSSIPSSPWQRDHSWKQTTPQKNISKQLVFCYKRPKKVQLIRSNKRRRPYDNSTENNLKVLSVDGINKNSGCNSKLKKQKHLCSLQSIIQMLNDKSVSSTPPRMDMLVSPRKRILREMEKDKVLAEDLCQKRSRNKVQSTTVGWSGSIVKVGSPVNLNGVTEEVRTQRNTSYSITSLLADDRNVKRSPNNSPSHFSVIQNQYCTPPPEERWYSESVDKLRSIELSHADKRSLSAFPHFSYVPQYVYPYQMYYPPGAYIRSGYNIAPPIYTAPPISLPIRPDAPSCSWAMEPTRDVEHRDENIADMPLNLSKHAG
ncbi:hypothetical protein Trydic_g4338 [Trypoxylus dichotomus]